MRSVTDVVKTVDRSNLPPLSFFFAGDGTLGGLIIGQPIQIGMGHVDLTEVYSTI